MTPHLRAISSPSHDPLAAARQAGNDALDRGLDALQVALRDFAEFRRHEAVVYPGIVQLVESLERSIRASQLAISALREAVMTLRDKITPWIVISGLLGLTVSTAGVVVVSVNHPPAWAWGLLLTVIGYAMLDGARYASRPWADND